MSTATENWLDTLPALPLSFGMVVLWGSSRAVVSRVRPGHEGAPWEHLDLVYDSGRRDTVDAWCVDRPKLDLDHPAMAREALSMWLHAASQGEDVPRINAHDPIVARVLLGATTDADRLVLARVLREMSR